MCILMLAFLSHYILVCVFMTALKGGIELLRTNLGRLEMRVAKETENAEHKINKGCILALKIVAGTFP